MGARIGGLVWPEAGRMLAREEGMAVLVVVLVAILRFWECRELEGGVAYLGVVEHLVRGGEELADAVVSYALPKCWRKGLVERMICGSGGMLNAILRVFNKSLTFHISLSQEGAKQRYPNYNFIPHLLYRSRSV